MQKQHIGVYGVFVRRGRILLTKKAFGPYKDRFDLPGGDIAHGESPDTALRRHVLHEAGLTVSQSAFECFHSNVLDVASEDGRQDYHHLAIIYRIQEIDEEHELDTINPSEERFMWRSIERLHEYHLSPHAWSEIVKLRKQILSMPVHHGTMTLIP